MSLGKYIAAFAASGMGLVGGLWLAVSPWVLGVAQPAGGWGPETLADFWTGAGVVLVSGVGLLLYGGSLAGELRQAGVLPARVLRAPAAPAGPAEAGTSGDRDGLAAAEGRRTGRAAVADVTETRLAAAGGEAVDGATDRSAPSSAAAADLDAVLVPLAAALLSDLMQRRGAAAEGDSGARGEAEVR